MGEPLSMFVFGHGLCKLLILQRHGLSGMEGSFPPGICQYYGRTRLQHV